jgi:hypothetical protein
MYSAFFQTRPKAWMRRTTFQDEPVGKRKESSSDNQENKNAELTTCKDCVKIMLWSRSRAGSKTQVLEN